MASGAGRNNRGAEQNVADDIVENYTDDEEEEIQINELDTSTTRSVLRRIYEQKLPIRDVRDCMPRQLV